MKYRVTFIGNDGFQLEHQIYADTLESALMLTPERLFHIQKLTIEKIVKITIEEIE